MKKIYAGMGITELRKLRQLDEENRKLKRLVADFFLNKHMLQEVKDRQEFLRMRIGDFAQSRIGYGYRRLHVLLTREGIDVNHKRVYRLNCEKGLTIRMKKEASP